MMRDTMRYLLLLLLVALGCSGCVVYTSAGAFDCTGAPVSGVIVVTCAPIQHASLP